MLMAALDPRRYEPVVVVHEDGPMASYLRDRGMDYQLLPLPAYVGAGDRFRQHATALLRSLPATRRFLRSNRIAIVHGQDGRMNQTWGPAARLAGAAFVWHQRSMYARSRLTRLAMRCADVVVCNSEFVRQGLPDEARPRALVLENPFDTAAAAPDRGQARQHCLSAIGAGDDHSLVGFVGNLTPQKRPEVFLAAAAELRRRLSMPIACLVFGRDRDGMKSKLLRMAAELGLGEDLHFMDFRDPIQPWIAACDVLLAPEVNDAFGRTLVEAMLVGTPVVASASGGHGEIVSDGETGLLVPADDAAAMADAATRILTDPALAGRLAAAGSQAARARYAVESHVTAAMSVYDRVSG